MKADLYNLKNEKVGTVDVPDSVFGKKWNEILVEQVLLAQLSNRRKPWAHTKGRGEVRGGGKKPWRQKGTGRARHGSIRSPIWIGGGKAHGPTKERDYSKKVNKKMRKQAILSVLSKKFKDNEIKFFDTLVIEPPKTKIAASFLKNILGLKKKSKKQDVLLIPTLENKALFRAARNLVKTKVISPDSLNVYDLLNYKNIFIDQGAVPIIGRVYSGIQI